MGTCKFLLKPIKISKYIKVKDLQDNKNNSKTLLEFIVTYNQKSLYMSTY